jgi:hypothetical protein
MLGLRRFILCVLATTSSLADDAVLHLLQVQVVTVSEVEESRMNHSASDRPDAELLLTHHGKLEKFSQRLFKKSDVDQDDALSHSEYEDAMRNFAKEGSLTASTTPEELDTLFLKFASSGNLLKADEFERVLNTILSNLNSGSGCSDWCEQSAHAWTVKCSSSWADSQCSRCAKCTDAAEADDMQSAGNSQTLAEQSATELSYDSQLDQPWKPEEVPTTTTAPPNNLCNLVDLNPRITQMSEACQKKVDSAIMRNTPLDWKEKCACYLEVNEKDMVNLDCRTMEAKKYTVAEEYRQCKAYDEQHLSA